VDNQWDAYTHFKSFSSVIHIDMHTKSKIFFNPLKFQDALKDFLCSYPWLGLSTNLLGLSTNLEIFDSGKLKDFGSGQSFTSQRSDFGPVFHWPSDVKP